MKTLVVHPDDRTTDFLKPIYNSLSDTTVLTGGTYSSIEMNNLIESHERVIMLGHGWQHGLLSKEVFTQGVYIIDEANADVLRNASVKDAYYDVFRSYTCPTNSNQVLAYNAERWYYYM